MKDTRPTTIIIDAVAVGRVITRSAAIHYANANDCAAAFERIQLAAQPLPRNKMGQGPRSRRVPAKIAAAHPEDPQ